MAHLFPLLLSHAIIMAWHLEAWRICHLDIMEILPVSLAASFGDDEYSPTSRRDSEYLLSSTTCTLVIYLASRGGLHSPLQRLVQLEIETSESITIHN